MNSPSSDYSALLKLPLFHVLISTFIGQLNHCYSPTNSIKESRLLDSALVASKHFTLLSRRRWTDPALRAHQMAQFSSISHLPPELLINIFEEIQRTQTLNNLRLVSHQFDALVAPILFRRMNLTWDIAQEFQRSADPASWTTQQLQVIHHTRHFVVDQTLSWPFIGSTLVSVQRLEHLT
jgi:hypothetical protein